MMTDKLQKNLKEVNILISHKFFDPSHDTIQYIPSIRMEKRDDEKKKIALNGIENTINLNAIYNEMEYDTSLYFNYLFLLAKGKHNLFIHIKFINIKFINVYSR
jgi:hypothetical protein